MGKLYKKKQIKPSIAGQGRHPQAKVVSKPQKNAWNQAAVAQYVLIVLLTGTFFLYDGRIRDPYLAPRFVFVATFVGVAIYWLVVRQKQSLDIASPLTRGFLGIGIAFIAWNIICTGQSVNITESIFFIARNFLFFLSFLLMLILLSRHPNPLTITKALTLALIALSYIGVFQFYDFAFTFIPGNPRPTGISGNRNLYASFLTLLLPFAFYTLLFAKPIWKGIAAIAISVGIFSVIIGQTRSAWLAFILGAIFFQIGFWIFQKKLPRRMVSNWRWGSLSLAAIIFLAVTIVIQTDKDGKTQALLQSRLQSLFSLNDLDPANEAGRNINERLIVWKGTVTMIQDAPLMGFGPGNWRLVFPHYGGMSALKDGTPEQIDKVRVQPHNVYLHITSETGIPGLLLMLSLGILLLIAALSNMRRAAQPAPIILNLLMVCSLFIMAVDMVFSFPNERIEHGLCMALIAALVFSGQASSGAQPAKTFYLSSTVYFSAIFPALLFCITLGSAKWKFDYYQMEVLQALTTGNHSKVLEAANKGKSKLVTLDPISDPMEFHAARSYAALGQYDKALEEITIAERFHPNSHRICNTKAVIYLSENRFREAIAPLEKAVRLSPDYQPALINLAYSYYRTDQYEASLQMLNRIDLSQDTTLQNFKQEVQYRSQQINRDDQ
ncbi:MAG TPA: O-antigen ligase family protein [Saprospiraceae bacterium]|mgnify:CR=1 FL=1|nr:O-antigen ligase family protein [Saprospiraceae bacterium]HMP24394.1 O-antigen ligase family protein [Saprospiraceae bacterium]